MMSASLYAQQKDVVLNIAGSTELGDEGYKIDIADRVEVTASSFRGLVWTTRTLLQIAEQKDGVLPRGQIVDYPDYLEEVAADMCFG